MELFLNLCWLSLLLPGWLLWRRRPRAADPDRSTTGSAGNPATRPFVFLCALGCAFILLFPVISASDDLHAMRPEREESERAMRNASRCTCALHALTHASQPMLPSSVSLAPGFEQAGVVLPFLPATLRTFSPLAPSGRAPPELAA